MNARRGVKVQRERLAGFLCRGPRDEDGNAGCARALQNGAPNIERADRLVQLIAKQNGLSHPAIDAQVALVDERLGANRKKAAAA